MRANLLLAALVVLGGLVATSSEAQQSGQGVGNTPPKFGAARPGTSAGSQHGALGGPTNKGAKTTGTPLRPKAKH